MSEITGQTAEITGRTALHYVRDHLSPDEWGARGQFPILRDSGKNTFEDLLVTDDRMINAKYAVNGLLKLNDELKNRAGKMGEIQYRILKLETQFCVTEKRINSRIKKFRKRQQSAQEEREKVQNELAQIQIDEKPKTNEQAEGVETLKDVSQSKVDELSTKLLGLNKECDEIANVIAANESALSAYKNEFNEKAAPLKKQYAEIEFVYQTALKQREEYWAYFNEARKLGGLEELEITVAKIFTERLAAFPRE